MAMSREVLLVREALYLSEHGEYQRAETLIAQYRALPVVERTSAAVARLADAVAMDCFDHGQLLDR